MVLQEVKMKLKYCIPGTIVKCTHDQPSKKNNTGQITFGLDLNSSNEVLVYVQWAGEIMPQSIHPGNLELLK